MSKLPRSFFSSRHIVFVVLVVSAISAFILPNRNLLIASFGSWGDSSLIHSCKNSRGGITIVGAGDSCNQNETQLAWVKDVDAGTGLTATRDSNGVTFSLATTDTSGWITAGETWTYASSDSPSFTFTISGDKTGKYSPGMRVKLTQTTDKYFLITKLSYSSPNTTVTIYGGTDYTLANASITSPQFSIVKAPFGFPLDPTKWTVETIYASNGNQSNPSADTWYNIGSVSINVPIGAWRLVYSTSYGFDKSTDGFYSAYVTLSTSNNSESDYLMTSSVAISGTNIATARGYKEKFVDLSSKTTYYMNVKTGSSGLNYIYNGDSAAPAVIRATSSYL